MTVVNLTKNYFRGKRVAATHIKNYISLKCTIDELKKKTTKQIFSFQEYILQKMIYT